MQYSEVKKICDELHKTGKPVSLDYLISKVPGAQASLVVHYQKWRNEQANRAPAPSATESLFSEDFVAAFQRESEQHAKKLTDQLNQQLQQAMQAEVLAAEHNRELQLELEQSHRLAITQACTYEQAALATLPGFMVPDLWQPWPDMGGALKPQRKLHQQSIFKQ